MAQAQAGPGAHTEVAFREAGSGDLQCPEIDDNHGQWEGSTAVGGVYTLTCAPGYEVIGTRGNRTHGDSTAHMICPRSLGWPMDLWCEDIDDCAALTHGCGAVGVCLDLVDGYDCNCEEGYPRTRLPDGEIVCGDAGQDICAGHTCGAYGICIDLRGNLTQFLGPMDGTANVSAAAHGTTSDHTFRCECTNAFYDNGQTCVRHDCGVLKDKLGLWVGSTLSGGEYTLKCPHGASVWGGALREITISCGNQGKWLSQPFCVNPLIILHDEEVAAMRFWTFVGVVLLCITSAALAAGLTLGLVSLDPFGLTVILSAEERDCRTSRERQKLRRDQWNAHRMLPLVRDHHMLLVTLLLFNTIANETLPICLDELLPSWAAVLLSVSVVLICGEILPSAVFTGSYQFSIAAAFVPFVQALQCALYPIAKPIARLLDYLIPEEAEGDMKYSRAELRALLQLHGPRLVEHDTAGRDREREAERSEPGATQEGEVCGCYEALVEPTDDMEAKPSEEPDSQPTESREDGRGAAQGGTILSAPELCILNGVLALRDVPLVAVAYARVEHCVLASAQDTVADVIARGVLQTGVRAVLLVEAPGSAPVPALAVQGCLQTSDLLRSGSSALSDLSQPWVWLPGSCTALGALQRMAAQGASRGVVLDGDDVQEALVAGVLASTDILCLLLRNHAGDPRSPRQARREAKVGSEEFPLPPIGRRLVRGGSWLFRARPTSTSEAPVWDAPATADGGAAPQQPRPVRRTPGDGGEWEQSRHEDAEEAEEEDAATLWVPNRLLKDGAHAGGTLLHLSNVV